MDVEESTVLSSWKDIARYLGKGVRTVQRWERDLHLPVRRPIGALRKSAVVLHRADVDAWLATRFTSRTLAKQDLSPRHGMPESVRADLRVQIERARQLRDTHLVLTQQITDAIDRLARKCDLLSAHTSKQVLPQPAVRIPLLPRAGRAANERMA